MFPHFSAGNSSCRWTSFWGLGHDDDNLCSTDTRCVQGSCIGAAVECADSDITCVQGACDAEEGCILFADDNLCDDDDPCTLDTCDETLGCLNEVAADGTPCGAFGSCEAIALCVAGTCTDFPVPNGTFCIDGDVCTVDDRCEEGVCIGNQTTGPIVQLDQVTSFGGPASLAAVDDDGHLVFLDRERRATRLTRVLRNGDALEAVESLAFDRPMTSLNHMEILGDVLLIVERTLTNLVVHPFHFSPELTPFGEPIALALDETESNLSPKIHLAQKDEFIFFCSGRHRDVGVITVNESGISAGTPISLTQGDSCADITFEDDILTIAEQRVRGAGGNFGVPLAPGALSTFSIDENAQPTAIASLVVDETLTACDDYSVQPLRLAAAPNRLVLGCGTGAIGSTTRRFNLQSLEPGSLVPLEPIPNSGSPNDMWWNLQGELQVKYDNFGDAVSLRGLSSSATTLQRIGPRGIDVAFNKNADTLVMFTESTYVFSSEDLRPLSGPGHGKLESLDVVTNGLATASRHSAHLLQTAPLAFIDGHSENSVSVFGYSTLGFGPGGSAPIVVVGQTGQHTDVSVPSNALATSELVAFTNIVAANGYIYEYRESPDEGRVLNVRQPNDASILSSLPLPPISFDSEAILRVEEQELLLVRRGSSSSLQFLKIDLTLPTLPAIVEQAIIPRRALPVDAMLAGDRVALLRGRADAGQRREAPDSEGLLEYFEFADSALTRLGLTDTPNAREILRLESNSAYLSAPSSLLFVDLRAVPQITQVIELPGLPSAIQISSDELYLASENAVTKLSPPCPAP